MKQVFTTLALMTTPALTEVPSNCTKSGFTCACSSACCTRCTSAASTLIVALPLETCTAGASP